MCHLFSKFLELFSKEKKSSWIFPLDILPIVMLLLSGNMFFDSKKINLSLFLNRFLKEMLSTLSKIENDHQ